LSYPEWPERWEFFDGIPKYDPHEPEEIGGEEEVAGIPLDRYMWIVACADPEEEQDYKETR
jgi:hypothetical protein